MSYIISAVSQKDTEFLKNERTILESHQYKAISLNTYLGQKSSSAIVNQQLKNDSIYKLEKTKCKIEIYHGSVTKV